MCTGIFIRLTNGEFVVGRTLEWGMPLKYRRFNNKKEGIKGTEATMDKQFKVFRIADAINKHGLFCAEFFFPDQAQYAKKPVDGNINIPSWEVAHHLLKNYTSVINIKKNISKLTVLDTKYPNSALPTTSITLHWFVCDSAGDCVVLEVVDGFMMIYDNSKYQVLTNSPPWPMQIANLYNYPHFSKYWRHNKHYGGCGSGAIGLPGDSTSPGRFVRAYFIAKNLFPAKNSKEGIYRILRALHNFDIPLGTVVDPKTGYLDMTIYSVAYALNTREIKYGIDSGPKYNRVINEKGTMANRRRRDTSRWKKFTRSFSKSFNRLKRLRRRSMKMKKS